jgi:hypothetical protein
VRIGELLVSEPDAVFVDPVGTFAGIAGLESFSDSFQKRLPDVRSSLRGEPQRIGLASLPRKPCMPATSDSS